MSIGETGRNPEDEKINGEENDLNNNLQDANKDKGTSRRRFIKGLVGSVAGGLMGAAGYGTARDAIPSKEQIDPEFPNIVRIENPEATFRIVNSLHVVENDPKSLEGADAVILEDIMTNALTPKLKNFRSLSKQGGEAQTFYENFPRAMGHQYEAIIKNSFEQHKPIFFVDLAGAGRYSEAMKEEIFSGVVSVLEGALATAGLLVNSKTEHKHGELSRRDFLKKAGIIAASTYLLTPAVERVVSLTNALSLQDLNEHSPLRKAERLIQKTNEDVHPETSIPHMALRNTLIAQKSETISKIMAKELGRKPIANIYIGAGHIGIEEELKKKSGDRLNELRKKLGDEFKSEGFIIRIDFLKDEKTTQQSVQINLIEDPSFKD